MCSWIICFKCFFLLTFMYWFVSLQRTTSPVSLYPLFLWGFGTSLILFWSRSAAHRFRNLKFANFFVDIKFISRLVSISFHIVDALDIWHISQITRNFSISRGTRRSDDFPHGRQQWSLLVSNSQLHRITTRLKISLHFHSFENYPPTKSFAVIQLFKAVGSIL